MQTCEACNCIWISDPFDPLGHFVNDVDDLVDGRLVELAFLGAVLENRGKVAHRPKEVGRSHALTLEAVLRQAIHQPIHLVGPTIALLVASFSDSAGLS